MITDTFHSSIVNKAISKIYQNSVSYEVSVREVNATEWTSYLLYSLSMERRPDYLHVSNLDQDNKHSN